MNPLGHNGGEVFVASDLVPFPTAGSFESRKVLINRQIFGMTIVTFEHLQTSSARLIAAVPPAHVGGLHSRSAAERP